MTFEKALHCSGCVAKVQRAVAKVEGSKQALVSKDMTRVTVAYDTRHAKPEAFRAALAQAGHPCR
jgi:copper chaperone CopZ